MRMKATLIVQSSWINGATDPPPSWGLGRDFGSRRGEWREDGAVFAFEVGLSHSRPRSKGINGKRKLQHLFPRKSTHLGHGSVGNATLRGWFVERKCMVQSLQFR